MDFLVAMSGDCKELSRRDTSLLSANTRVTGEDHLCASDTDARRHTTIKVFTAVRDASVGLDVERGILG